MRLFLGFVLSVVPLIQAQSPTRLPLRALDLAGQPSSSVFIIGPDGTMRAAQLGAGLILDMNSNPPTLRAAAPAPLPLHIEILAHPAPGAPWQLPREPAGAVLITLDGLVMAPGRDYTLTGRTLTWAPQQQPDQKSNVLALYQ